MVVSTHFMESQAERDWIDRGKGDFAKFFENFAPGSKPVNDALGYISLFEDTKVLFTHATKADDNELQMMQKLGYITHCPISNRLLNNGKLSIDKVEKLTLGTDGLSSNITLNLWEEMRAALWMHSDIEPNELAKKLLIASTKEGGASLDRNCGEIVEGKDADMIIVMLPASVQEVEALALQTVLHTQKAQQVFIAGDLIK